MNAKTGAADAASSKHTPGTFLMGDILLTAGRLLVAKIEAHHRRFSLVDDCCTVEAQVERRLEGKVRVARSFVRPQNAIMP